MDATLHTTGQVTFATTTSLYLSFDDKSVFVVKGSGDSESLICGACQGTFLNVNSILAH